LTVVGFLAPASLDTYPLYLAAFRKGLNKLGFVEVQNVAIEYRWVEVSTAGSRNWQPVSWQTNSSIAIERAMNARARGYGTCFVFQISR
jgi:hypothetical protein